jgi:hypothetical protein
VGNAVPGMWFTSDKGGKKIGRGTMDAEINNVIYMELYSGPKMAHDKYEKTNVARSIDRDSTVSNLETEVNCKIPHDNKSEWHSPAEKGYKLITGAFKKLLSPQKFQVTRNHWHQAA